MFQRNSFRNRSVWNDDLRVLKNFKLGNYTRRIQFSAEFFNLFNVANLTGYSGTLNQPGYGQPREVWPCRQWTPTCPGST